MEMKDLINKIAEVGREHQSLPHLSSVDVFKPYCNEDGTIDSSKLTERDGNCTVRELMTRYLFLNAVLDQGPDMEGVRELLSTTINELYKKEIRILHTPLNFFKELGIVIDDIDSTHEIVRRARQETWRTNNQTRKTYNLFMDNTTQTMSYAVFRWGVPLAVPLILSKENPDYDEVLLDYLERDDSDCGFPSSAEMMTRKIKDHKKYGLGKAIGDKAAHLFAKWMVYSFRLTRVQAKSWSKYSYEIPFDSNAGRVLFRTGFYLNFLHEDEMKVKSVIQPNAGKNGKHYLRITNSRGLKVTKNLDDLDMKRYSNLCVNYLKTHKRKPGKIEIQRVPILLLLHDAKYGVGEFDDGLMHIGTHYCFNVETPNCEECPLKDYCQGYNDNRDLIKDYRT